MVGWHHRLNGHEFKQAPGVRDGQKGLATGDQWRNNSRKNEGMQAKQKQYPVIDVTGDRSKVQRCKEEYCTGTWNVRSMNQGKLEVVKRRWQE